MNSQMAARAVNIRNGRLARPKSAKRTMASPTIQVLVNCAWVCCQKNAERKSQAPKMMFAMRAPA